MHHFHNWLKYGFPDRTIAVLCVAIVFFCLLLPISAGAEQPVELKYSRIELVKRWRVRIQALLDQGKMPLIDMESSLPNEIPEEYVKSALAAMDSAGVALIVLDGAQAPKDGSSGYRWGYGVERLVNSYPNRFVLATNGGTSSNWVKLKSGSTKHFIDQTEQHARSGVYPIMGEFEFRHYMSSSQCLSSKTHRDVSVPLTSKNGHSLFALSEETGLPFLIHLEPEDSQFDDLEIMLKAYPKAKVIVCHFGQLRHPERQTRFSVDLIRRLMMAYPNLYFDLSTGHPGRKYPCSGVYDTVLWLESIKGQRKRIKPEYRELLTTFSNRFVSGFDYGGSRGPWGKYIKARAANIRLIIRDLTEKAQRDICYRTAWHLLAGKQWQ